MIKQWIIKLCSVLALCCLLQAASVPSNTTKTTEDVCDTKACKDASDLMVSKIDSSVAPCDNFYSFACGNFIKNTKIPDDKSLVDSFEAVRDILKDQLKTVITSPVEDSDIDATKAVKQLYSACLNQDLIEQRGLKPINDVMQRMGGWPAVVGDDWDESAWSWQKSILDCRANGYSNDFLLEFSVATNLADSSKKIIGLDQTDLGLAQPFLLKGVDNAVVSAYNSFQIDMAVLYGADRKRAEKEMKEALEFEIRLAKISLPTEKRRNATALWNLFSIKEFQQKYPFNDWLSFFNALLPPVSQVTEDEIINIYDVPFFDQVDEVFKTTPQRTIANYVMWRVAAASTNYLTEKLRERQLGYAKALIGQQAEIPRWKECIDTTTSNLEIAVAALYVRKYFKEESKAAALTMVNAIRDEFEDILKKVTWMDKKTCEAALVKANKMVTHIGYPDELMDAKKLSDYYKNVHVDSDKYFESHFSIAKFKKDLDYEKLRQAVNKTDWKTHSNVAVVGAAYSSIENSIRFPAGILQANFFNAERPKYMNFAAIGSIIGHEITHGFDDQGRQFDVDGNLRDWWGKSTAEAYLEKAKCIIDQYANFTDAETGLNLNGINTQGENIADNGGLKEAYLAYQKFVKANGKEKPLPSLNYTPNQLFWLSSAQVWCSVIRPEDLKKRILTGVHSPNQFRVLGTLHNLEEFSKDFSCPEGSNMNPIKKCQVW